MPMDHSAMEDYFGRARGVLIAVGDLLPAEVLHGMNLTSISGYVHASIMLVS